MDTDGRVQFEEETRWILCWKLAAEIKEKAFCKNKSKAYFLILAASWKNLFSCSMFTIMFKVRSPQDRDWETGKKVTGGGRKNDKELSLAIPIVIPRSFQVLGF